MSSPRSDQFWDATGFPALYAAWEKVHKNGGCSGGDGITLDHFAHGLRGRLLALSEQVRGPDYAPRPYRHLQIAKPDGGTRPLTIPSIRDRVLQTAIATALVPILEPGFDPDSYGYRPGKSVDMAVRRISALRGQGFGYVAEADIVRCFESIPHDPLLVRLRDVLGDLTGARRVVDLVALWLEHAGMELATPGLGLPQGSPLSPLLSNLYLDQMDDALDRDGITLIRFADDFVLMAKTEAAALRALARSGEVLRTYGLELHSDQCRVVSFDEGFRFLGHLFVRSLTLKQASDPVDDPLSIMRQLRMDEAADAQSQSARKSELAAGFDRGARVLYVQDPDRRLGLSNLSYCVRTQAGRALLTLSPDRVGRIEIAPGVEIETEAIRQALHSGTGLSFVNGRGETLGQLTPEDPDAATLHLAQARVVLDPALATEVARALVDARIRNMRARLQVLNRSDKRADVIQTAKDLGRMLRKLPVAPDVASLRGHEGAAAALYWPALARLCPVAPKRFRRRRPATDPLNAAINFLTALLSRDVRIALLKVGLHPGFGCLHANTDGHEACVWDLIEGPRALYTEGLPVALFRQNRLKAEMFEATETGAIRISSAGRRALIVGYEAAMERRVTSGKAGKKRAGRAQLIEDARAYARWLRNPEGKSLTFTVQDY